MKISDYHSKLLAIETQIVQFKTCLLKAQKSVVDNLEFQNILDFTIEHLKTVTENLKNDRSFKPFFEFIEERNSKKIKEFELLNEIADGRATESTLKKNLEEFKDESKLQIKNMENQILEKNQENFEKLLTLETEFRFFENALSSRNKENSLRFRHMEKQLEDELMELNNSISRENEIMHKIKMFYKEITMKMKNEADQMQEFYDRRAEELEFEYQLTLKDKEDVEKTLKEDQTTFEERQKVIDDYKEEVKNRLILLALLKKQNAAALMLQSVWRGVMVRNFLGQFKKNKKRAREIHRQILEVKRLEAEKKKKRNMGKKKK